MLSRGRAEAVAAMAAAQEAAPAGEPGQHAPGRRHPRPFVVVGSPWAAVTEEGAARNRAYALDALADSLQRGEAPVAPHLLYPAVLDDAVAAERARGVEAGQALIARCALLAVYVDFGISPGMRAEIAAARAAGVPVVFRDMPEAAR